MASKITRTDRWSEVVLESSDLEGKYKIYDVGSTKPSYQVSYGGLPLAPSFDNEDGAVDFAYSDAEVRIKESLAARDNVIDIHRVARRSSVGLDLGKFLMRLGETSD